MNPGIYLCGAKMDGVDTLNNMTTKTKEKCLKEIEEAIEYYLYGTPPINPEELIKQAIKESLLIK